MVGVYGCGSLFFVLTLLSLLILSSGVVVVSLLLLSSLSFTLCVSVVLYTCHTHNYS